MNQITDMAIKQITNMFVKDSTDALKFKGYNPAYLDFVRITSIEGSKSKHFNGFIHFSTASQNQINVLRAACEYFYEAPMDCFYYNGKFLCSVRDTTLSVT